MDDARVIDLCHCYVTGDQFHSELKRDRDLERLASDKSRARELVLLLGGRPRPVAVGQPGEPTGNGHEEDREEKGLSSKGPYCTKGERMPWTELHALIVNDLQQSSTSVVQR